MLVLRFAPSKDKGSVVKGEGLYDTLVSSDRSNYRPLGLTVRARTAADAEKKVLFVFCHELAGKTLDFDLASFLEEKPDEGREEGKESKDE
jgi:hypothetical protein